jgi:hypothetical protein
VEKETPAPGFDPSLRFEKLLESVLSMPHHAFYVYDYRRGKFRAYLRQGPSLAACPVSDEGTFRSPSLGMTFGLDDAGRLWVRRPDGELMETQRQIRLRAEAEAQRAEAEAEKARRLAAKLRELGIDPDTV